MTTGELEVKSVEELRAELCAEYEKLPEEEKAKYEVLGSGF